MKTTEEAEAYQRGWNDAIKMIISILDAEREIRDEKRKRERRKQRKTDTPAGY